MPSIGATFSKTRNNVSDTQQETASSETTDSAAGYQDPSSNQGSIELAQSVKDPGQGESEKTQSKPETEKTDSGKDKKERC